MIQGDNPAGHCFVLRDLFPMSFFKLVMIMLLEIYVARKIFDKIYLKGKKYLFFQYVVCDQRREGGLGVIFNRQGEFKLLVLQGGTLLLFPFLSVTS